MVTDRYLDEFIKLVSALSPRLRIAYQEVSDSMEKDREATHYFKLDETRLGRDFKVYDFLGESIGWPSTLVFIVEEIVTPLQERGVRFSLELKNHMINWGLQIYPEGAHEPWLAICNDWKW